jgi:hypothetical protein
MATTLTYRNIIDLPEWRSLAQPLFGGSNTIISTAGIFFAEDFRSRDYASPSVYFAGSVNNIYAYNTKNDAWFTHLTSLALNATFGQGSTAVFCPTFSPRGTIAAGATTLKFTLTTALPASVATNQLANRGDGLGYIVRVVGNGAGGSGKIEERRVIANTSGTTPTVYLDKALSFTPVSGDTYEFLSGSVLFLNTGSPSAGSYKRFDLLTNSISNLSTTGLPTIGATANYLIALDEQYVSADRNPGEGFLVGASTYDTAGDFSKGCLLATATAASTITGQASSGDAAVAANQFRNYQIRIVEDTVNTTAVGQRRRISSNTAGPSPVYTLATNWTVTPSSNCKFVIENDTDRLLAFPGGSTITYNYFITNLGNTAATANTWDTTSWATRTNAVAAGAMIGHAFGISHNNITENNIKPIIYATRGSGTVYDIFDVAGAATGAWTQGLNMVEYVGVTYENIIGSVQDLYNYAYDPHSNKGRYFYFFGGSSSSTLSNQRSFMRFDLIGSKLEKIAGPKIGTGNTVPNGKYSFFSVFQDGDTKISFYNTPRPVSTTDYFQLMITS